MNLCKRTETRIEQKWMIKRESEMERGKIKDWREEDCEEKGKGEREMKRDWGRIKWNEIWWDGRK